MALAKVICCVSCGQDEADHISLYFCESCLLEVVRVIELHSEDHDVDWNLEAFVKAIKSLLKRSDGKGSDSVRMQGQDLSG